jgi:hypothetical protein
VTKSIPVPPPSHPKKVKVEKNVYKFSAKSYVFRFLIRLEPSNVLQQNKFSPLRRTIVKFLDIKPSFRKNVSTYRKMSFYNSLRYLFPIQKMHDSLSSQKLLYPYCTVKVPPTFTYSVERWGDMQDRFSVAYLHTRLCLAILY